MVKIKGRKVLKINLGLKKKTHGKIWVKSGKINKIYGKGLPFYTEQVKSSAIIAQPRNTLKFIPAIQRILINA
jgi:hypothetical protein